MQNYQQGGALCKKYFVLHNIENKIYTIEYLENKRYDSLASLRVVGELLFVVAMFAECPNSHLVETGGGE